MGACTREWKGMTAGVLMATPCTASLYLYSESTMVPELGGSTLTVPFWTGIATGGSLPVQHVTTE